MKFADCITRISQGKGQNMREVLNPTTEFVRGVLTTRSFPKYTGPMSKAEMRAIKESIKNTPILSHLPEDQFYVIHLR